MKNIWVAHNTMTKQLRNAGFIKDWFGRFKQAVHIRSRFEMVKKSNLRQVTEMDERSQSA